MIYENSVYYRTGDCNTAISRYALRRGGMQFSGSSTTLVACGGTHVNPRLVDGTTWRLSGRGDLHLLAPNGDVILVAGG